MTNFELTLDKLDLAEAFNDYMVKKKLLPGFITEKSGEVKYIIKPLFKNDKRFYM